MRPDIRDCFKSRTHEIFSDVEKSHTPAALRYTQVCSARLAL